MSDNRNDRTGGGEGAFTGKPVAPLGASAVVGIGASAGGLDALKAFFQAMPSDSGVALIVVQHLEPAHESQMAGILSKYTAMPVAQAEDGMPVHPNRVYTIPPNKYLAIRAGRLRLTEPQERHGLRMAIDFFFRSLAEEQQDKAIGIILSGSGSDGTHGLRAVRSAGGVGMAQDPTTAQFGFMPQSAIDTGLVDYVLPADQMPAALVAYLRHPATGTPDRAEPAEADSSEALDAILALLRSRIHSDYRCYKQGTVVRRIERRMGLTQVADMAEYLQVLRRDPQEAVQLAKDMLIGVSAFFRDAEAFEALRTLAIIPLVASKSADSPVRVWVPGCATGEEAYSVAILVLEALDAAGKGNAVQVFASDVDEAALETARAGRYGTANAADLSPQRLERFFVQQEDRYQVGKRLRDAVVFARQNLLADPPFSKLDLITCRNVLIYLQPEAQRKVLALFSFALTVGGYLFLGKSEAPADPRELFEVLSKPGHLYRLVRPNRHAPDLPVFSGASRGVGITPDRVPAPRSATELSLLNQQMLLAHFGAASLLVDPKGRILHFAGQTERYLGHPTGQASLNVFDLAVGSLAAKLRRALAQALQTGAAVTIHQVPLGRKGARPITITVAPVPGRARDGTLLAILLQDAPRPAAGPAPGTVLEEESALVQLEAENRILRAELEETSQDHEAASEELKAANEEVMSMNEELQSTNEELETSKEELQSINEELGTVNTQLSEKIGELTEANNNLANLASATEIATVFLDAALRIKQFTPRATELLNLMPVDVGRPLGHITQRFDGETLSAVATTVMQTLVPVEQEVRLPEGRWYTMRVLPYRTLENRIDGAVVTFMDVSRLKRLEASVQRAKAYAESIIGTVREPLLVLDADLRVVSANAAFYRLFAPAPTATVGAFVYALGEGQWNTPDLRRLLEEILPARAAFHDFQVEQDFPGLGRRVMRLNARRMEPTDDQPALILLAIEDVTTREQARRQIEALAAELEQRVQERTADLARTVAGLEEEVRERLAAEERLRQSMHLAENRLAELERVYDAAPAGLALLDPELRYVRVNERLAALNGKPVSEHIGRTFRDVVPHVADLMEGHARQVLATGEPLLNLEGSGLIPGKGQAHWVASYLPVTAEDGTIVGLSGMVLDITERKQAEERILAINRLLALFSRETTRPAYLECVLPLLQEAAGSCRCVGIRLRADGGEVPYEVSTGFSPEFLDAESRLQLGRDECACTRVVAGQPRPCDASVLTPGGSFVCTNTAALLNRLTEEERRYFRGVCVQAGFASVAVVPIRHQGAVVGAIHLADERPDLFPPDVVAFLEAVSPVIGEAVQRFTVEETLRQSEQRYRSLVTASSQIVWTTNAQGHAVDIPSWRAFTGQSQEESQGWGWADALHPEDRDRTAAIWLQAVNTQASYDTEYRVRRADGVYRNFAVRGVPVLEPDGVIREWVGTCTDITERKEAEVERHRLAQHRQLALSAASLGWWHYDPATRVATWDDRYQEIFGVSGHQDPIEAILARLHPDDTPHVEAAAEAALDPNTRSVYHAEYRVRLPDGTVRWVEAHGLAAFEDDGIVCRATGFVGTVADITAHKQADEALIALNTTLAQRASQLSALATALTLAEQQERQRMAQVLHDGLQQLLVATKLGVHSIRQKNPTNEGLAKDCEEVGALLDETLQMCRSLVVEMSPAELSEVGLVAAVTRLGGEMKRLHGLDVSVTAEAECSADASGVVLLLFRAVRELLFNVVKHAGVTSVQVRISRPADNRVQLEIVDEGAGFDTSAPDREKRSATGLGLFGLQARLAQMGGHMEVDSVPGRGTRVVLQAEIRPFGPGNLK